MIMYMRHHVFYKDDILVNAAIGPYQLPLLFQDSIVVAESGAQNLWIKPYYIY